MWKEPFKAESYYDFDYSLKRWNSDPLTHISLDERWVDIPVKSGEDSHVVRVQGYGSPEDPSFEVMSDSLEAKDELVRHIQKLFQWDKDLRGVYDHFLDTNLKQLFENYPGTPIVKDFHLYDCLMKVIIHQQLNMKFAYTLSTRFVEKYGKEKHGVWFYPRPEEVAEIPYESLREMQFSQRKAEYIIDTSRKIADGELDLISLADHPDEEVLKQLVKIRGIGPWSAENWLMFGVGRENLLPKGDVGIQNALKKHFNLNQKPTVEQMMEDSQDWDPYRSYASLTLWRSIEGS